MRASSRASRKIPCSRVASIRGGGLRIRRLEGAAVGRRSGHGERGRGGRCGGTRVTVRAGRRISGDFGDFRRLIWALVAARREGVRVGTSARSPISFLIQAIIARGAARRKAAATTTATNETASAQ